MNAIPSQLDECTSYATLQERMRSQGIVLIGCDCNGRITHCPQAGDDWLSDLFCESPYFRTVLRRIIEQWELESDPGETEAWPGCWLSPMPLVNRRRRSGYSVAIILTEPFLDSEHLHAMCQSARLDTTLTMRWLRELPPAGETDVPRLATLVRYIHQDQRQLNSEQSAVESVGQQLAESYEEINLLYTIIQSMTEVDNPERFVSIACEELLQTLPYAWIGIMLTEEHIAFEGLSGRLIVTGNPGQPVETLQGLATELLGKAEPDAPMVLEPGRRREHGRYAPLGNTVLVHPMTREGKVFGLLIAGDKQGPDTVISSVDMKLLGATGSHAGIFFENAALYDDLNSMFMGTVEALTAAIDAKDRYTCGHSQRVAHLSARLARAIGLGEATVKRLHIAGMVHDVGKIGVPERVLCKPGRLTDDEFAWIRRHPEMGYHILKDIPQLQDVLPGVLHHHERWDGNGYPHGLSGEGIDLFGRIIALADSFDAMSSNRTYRSAMSRDKVLEEIMNCAGTQFDPDLVPVFVKLDFSQFDRMVNEHRAADDGRETTEAA